VKMGNENGEVIVDGDKHVPLANGMARVELAPGTHSVEVSTKNGTGTQKRNIAVTAGKETVVDLALATTVVAPGEPPKEESSFPVKKAVGGGLLAVGVASAVVSIIMASKYASTQSEGEDVAKIEGNKLPEGKTADDVCGKELESGSKICNLNSDAKGYSAVAWITGGAGVALIGAGVYFLFFGSSSSEKPAAASTKPIKNLRAAPMFGLGTNGVSLTGSF